MGATRGRAGVDLVARGGLPTRPAEVEAAAIVAFRARLLAWHEANCRDLPWRHAYDPYAVLVSEVMLQQTQVGRVIPMYHSWLRAYPRLEELAAAPLDDVLRLWQGLGYNTRALRLRECASSAVVAADGEDASLPRTLAELRKLPGIGPYTARAVLIFAHNDDLAAVDTNVRRVLTHEFGLSPTLPPAALQSVAEAVLPRGRSRDWHNALMDYGAQVLTARATGVRPPGRQGAFVGSRRWQRSRLLRAVLEHGPRPIDELAVTLELSPDAVADLVALLERDGLVAVGPGGVRIA